MMSDYPAVPAAFRHSSFIVPRSSFFLRGPRDDILDVAIAEHLIKWIEIFAYHLSELLLSQHQLCFKQRLHFLLLRSRSKIRAQAARQIRKLRDQSRGPASVVLPLACQLALNESVFDLGNF